MSFHSYNDVIFRDVVGFSVDILLAINTMDLLLTLTDVIHYSVKPVLEQAKRAIA